MKTVLVLNTDQMGHGDAQLGGRILQTMLNKATALRELEAILFYNGGARLAAEGSACLQALAALERNGVDLIICGTCVDHYGLRESIKVGHIGSMDDILATMQAADKVITL